MGFSTPPPIRLVADVGGTNTRLALFDPNARELRATRHYVNQNYDSLEDIIAIWLQDLDEQAPPDFCLAVAAPAPYADVISMLNMDWSFSLSNLKERFGFTRLRCINDFEANAYALPHLPGNHLATIRPGSGAPGGRLATLGPGTGLGGATLDRTSGVPTVRASEPGHMGLAPATELELALFGYLQPRYGEVYAELLLSGPGLQRLYQSLAALWGRELPALTPEEISARGRANECECCRQSLDTFCALLGSISGDFVLANGAYGGLYLAGGVTPPLADFLIGSTFERRFQEKGKMREHLSRVPLYIITGGVAGLWGAAHAPL